MARKMTPAQQATHDDLVNREGVGYSRLAWEGKTLLLGVGMARQGNEASSIRMYRITEDGKAVGV